MKMKTVLIHTVLRRGGGVIDLGTEERLVPATQKSRYILDVSESLRRFDILEQNRYETELSLHGEDDE